MHVHVSIVGLDRLSGSFALALKRYQEQPKAEHTFTIIGNDLRGHVMKTAEKLGMVDNFDRKLHKATANADLIVINAPASQLEDIYARLGPELKPGAVVLDLTPLKGPGIAWSHRHFPKNADGQPLAYMVGITPIVNVKGLYEANWDVETASAALFDEADVLVAPDPQCPAEAIALTEDIVRLIGGIPRFMDPAEHDGLSTATEGLPALLGVVLFNMLQQSEGWMEFRRMINPAFALAIQNLRHHSPQDLQTLFTANRADLVRHLDTLIGGLNELRDILDEGPDEDGEMYTLEAYIQRVGREWEKWDTKRHSGKWEDKQKLEPTSNLFGGIGSMITPRRPMRDD
ncbi:MAG: prephenate dehydrogenase/arogenate dehydrogenase family protein, partial [Anaerolineae bacterium]|nr:prephenate dehydrogenase/arogenate dehydrogenase family protein [Anaerolineae bacterium]